MSASSRYFLEEQIREQENEISTADFLFLESLIQRNDFKQFLEVHNISLDDNMYKMKENVTGVQAPQQDFNLVNFNI